MLLESVSIRISNCKKRKEQKIETKFAGIIKECDCDRAVTLLTLKLISHLDDLPSYLVAVLNFKTQNLDDLSSSELRFKFSVYAMKRSSMGTFISW